MNYCHTFKKILVTGSKGQLGRSIHKLVSLQNQQDNFIFVDIDELNICDSNDVRSFVTNSKVDFIINCAAYTSVDKAEIEQDKSALVNSNAIAYLAAMSKEAHIPIIHISTDFIFDGKKSTPYVESDFTNPLSIYGSTKLEGEKQLIKRASCFAIIRTSWLYSEYGNNFVKTMLNLAKQKTELSIIYDQIGTPTYATDLALAVLTILNKMGAKSCKEILHYSNEGVASWYDFAKAIFEISNINIKVNPIETKDYPTPAQRPKYSVLNKQKIKNIYNISIPYWRDSLKDCLNKIREEA